MSLPVRKCHLCVLGMNVYLELLLWSPGLFLLICLLCIITDCSFMMFTTE